MMSGNYTSIDNQKVSGSVPAVSDSPHIAVKFAESNLQTFPPSEAQGKISSGGRPPRDADDTFSKPRGGSKERNLDEKEKTVLALIRGAGDMGIWKGSLRREANFVVDNSLKTLLLKGLIKEVPDVQAKGKKRYMGVEFEPSTELTGGVWYQDGVFDADMIDNLRKARKVFLSKHKVMNAEAILNMVKKSGGFEFDIKIEHIKQVVETLCLENVVFKVKGNGLGEFASFPIGSECYKLRPKQKKVGAFASIPCGACPRITQCTPDGIISPATCVYYDTWLDF